MTGSEPITVTDWTAVRLSDSVTPTVIRNNTAIQAMRMDSRGSWLARRFFEQTQAETKAAESMVVA